MLNRNKDWSTKAKRGKSHTLISMMGLKILQGWQPIRNSRKWLIIMSRSSLVYKVVSLELRWTQWASTTVKPSLNNTRHSSTINKCQSLKICVSLILLMRILQCMTAKSVPRGCSIQETRRRKGIRVTSRGTTSPPRVLKISTKEIKSLIILLIKNALLSNLRRLYLRQKPLKRQQQLWIHQIQILRKIWN